MTTELHIQIAPDTFEPAETILADFPFEPEQSIVSFSGGIIVIDLGGADDSTYVQDWYLNNNELVQSYYVVED